MLKYRIKSFHCLNELKMDSGKQSKSSLSEVAGRLSHTINSRGALGTPFIRGSKEWTLRLPADQPLSLQQCSVPNTSDSP